METVRLLEQLTEVVKKMSVELEMVKAELAKTKRELEETKSQLNTLECDYNNHGHWTNDSSWCSRLVDKRRNHTVSS